MKCFLKVLRKMQQKSLIYVCNYLIIFIITHLKMIIAHYLKKTCLKLVDLISTQ